MSASRQVILTILLVALVSLGAVTANLALLRSTQDSSDPVGRLSPRAVFSSGRQAPNDATHTGTKPSSRGDGHETTPDD